ncbi:RICIN domain-containing protein [Streptomyces sp. NPDC003011]
MTRPAEQSPTSPAARAESGSEGGNTTAVATAVNVAQADPDPEPESDAAAAAKSRLPALVRTMTVTAIDRPQQRTRPVGRPGRAVLAGAAVVGALLVSVPFLVLDDNNRDNGAWLHLWSCAGTDNQKWSVV